MSVHILICSLTWTSNLHTIGAIFKSNYFDSHYFVVIWNKLFPSNWIMSLYTHDTSAYYTYYSKNDYKQRTCKEGVFGDNFWILYYSIKTKVTRSK